VDWQWRTLISLGNSNKRNFLQAPCLTRKHQTGLVDKRCSLLPSAVGDKRKKKVLYRWRQFKDFRHEADARVSPHFTQRPSRPWSSRASKFVWRHDTLKYIWRHPDFFCWKFILSQSDFKKSFSQYSWSNVFVFDACPRDLWWNYARHLRNIDCLMVRTTCLVCFINTVNGRSKRKGK
jgi:hypothetical protein